jgi:flagellar biosynthesis protein
MKNKKPRADVAVALQYDGKNAPRVTAKGQDEVARRIREIAEQHDVPLYEDIVLAQVLSQIELGEEIPPSLYVAVAQVIAFAYLMADRICLIPPRPDGTGRKSPPLLPRK